jgi:hypothetical protein
MDGVNALLRGLSLSDPGPKACGRVGPWDEAPLDGAIARTLRVA